MTTPHRAYGYARISAKRAEMLSRDDVNAVRFASDETSAARAAQAVGIASESRRLATLLVRYRTMLRCYPDAARLVRALFRTHEVENLKLGWRAMARKIDDDRWTPLWHDFGEMSTLSIDVFRGAQSLRQAVDRMHRTPFETIARDVYLAHANDVGAAELAFDRWVSLQIVAEAESLEREPLARQIAEALVRQRDDEIVARGPSAYALSAAAVEAARALPKSRKRVDLQRLCRRAFAGQPMRIAPAVAFIALAERDYRLGRALAERRGDAQLDAAVDRVIEESAGV